MKTIPMITVEQAAFLQGKKNFLALEKMSLIAEAYANLKFEKDSEAKAFIEAVMTGQYEVETGWYYINPNHPVNVATGQKVEQFISKETTFDNLTNEKTTHIGLGDFRNATKFSKDDLAKLPEAYQVYNHEAFIIPESTAHRIYGDYNNWLATRIARPETKNTETPVEPAVTVTTIAPKANETESERKPVPYNVKVQ